MRLLLLFLLICGCQSVKSDSHILLSSLELFAIQKSADQKNFVWVSDSTSRDIMSGAEWKKESILTLSNGSSIKIERAIYLTVDSAPSFIPFVKKHIILKGYYIKFENYSAWYWCSPNDGIVSHESSLEFEYLKYSGFSYPHLMRLNPIGAKAK